MYTGIVDHVGKILSFELLNGNYRLSILSEFSDFVLGESISIDGVCLTVTGFEGNTFHCDISPETFRVTTAQFFEAGQWVNVERSLRVGDRMGGHHVMGHVDAYCRLAKRIDHGDCVEMRFSGMTKEGRRYVIPKGSIAINGVSLTVNAVEEDGFAVMLIPQTLEIANLSHLKEGDAVNIEYDWMVKTVVLQLEQRELV